MKKGLLYLLLFSWSILVLKPALPAISDKIAHICWYSEHMATVHYEHGKYHVHAENLDEARKGYPEKDTNLPKSGITIIEHNIPVTLYDFTLPGIIRTHSSVIASSLLHTYLTTDFPPPRK